MLFQPRPLNFISRNTFLQWKKNLKGGGALIKNIYIYQVSYK